MSSQRAASSSVALECPWFHVDPSVPAVQWHYRDGFQDVVTAGAGHASSLSRVFVQTSATDSTHVDLRLTDSVFAAKEWIHASEVANKEWINAKEGIPPHFQSLTLGNRVLDDDRSLRAQGVTAGSTLHLVDNRPLGHQENVGASYPSAPKQVRLRIKTYCKTITLRARLTDSVFRLKEWIHSSEGIPQRFQKLRFGASILDDDSTLRSQGIRKDSCLHLVDERTVSWSCLKTTSAQGDGVGTRAAVFFQSHGSTLDIFCVEKNEIPLDRLSLEFPDNEEVLDNVNVTTWPSTKKDVPDVISIQFITRCSTPTEDMYKVYNFRREERGDWKPTRRSHSGTYVPFSISRAGTSRGRGSTGGRASPSAITGVSTAGGSLSGGALDLTYVTIQSFAWTRTRHIHDPAAAPDELIFCECAEDRVSVRCLDLSPAQQVYPGNSGAPSNAKSAVAPREVDSFRKESLMKSLLKCCWPDRTHLLSSVHRVNNSTIAALFAMDNEYTLHLLARQPNGRFRRTAIQLEQGALGSEFKQVAVSDPIYSSQGEPTFRLCIVTNRHILVYNLQWQAEELPAVELLGFGIGRGQTLQRLVTDPNAVRVTPWLAGWNAIPDIRMGSDEKLWLVVEQDPRPRHDRARHMTAQVYWANTKSVGRGGFSFTPTTNLRAEDVQALRANADLSEAVSPRRHSLAGVDFGGLTFNCCSFGSSVTAFVHVDQRELALPMPERHSASPLFERCELIFADVDDDQGPAFSAASNLDGPQHWSAMIQRTLLRFQLQQAARSHRLGHEQSFQETGFDGDFLLADDLFVEADDGRLRYFLQAAARRLVCVWHGVDPSVSAPAAALRKLQRQLDVVSNDLQHLPDFLEKALPWAPSGNTSPGRGIPCDPRFVGVFVSLTSHVLSAHASLMQALCTQLVYCLFVARDSPSIGSPEREQLEHSMRVGMVQLHLLMLARRALRQLHQRDGRNLARFASKLPLDSARTNNNNNAGIWAPNSVTAVEAFLRSRDPLLIAGDGQQQPQFIDSIVKGIARCLLPVCMPGGSTLRERSSEPFDTLATDAEGRFSLQFLKHLKNTDNYLALRQIRRRLFAAHARYSASLHTQPTGSDEDDWLPWMPRFEDIMKVIPIDDEIRHELFWSPESIFDASRCLLLEHSRVMQDDVDGQSLDVQVDDSGSGGDFTTDHLENLRTHLHWLRTLLRAEEGGHRKALEAGTQVLFPTRHVENKRGVIDDYDSTNGSATFLRVVTSSATSQSRAGSAVSLVSEYESESVRRVRRNVVRPVRRFFPGQDRYDYANYMTLSYATLHRVVTMAKFSASTTDGVPRALYNRLRIEEFYITLFSEQRGSRRFIDALELMSKSRFLQSLATELHKQVVEEVFYGDDLGWLKDVKDSAVAETLLDTCQMKWLEKIAEEGRPAVAGVVHDMDLKDSTLQHLFRLCCKTYALREQQANELTESSPADAAKKLRAAAVFMDNVATGFHNTALGVQRIQVGGSADPDELEKQDGVLGTCFDRQRFALLAAVNAWRRRLDLLRRLCPSPLPDTSSSQHVRVVRPSQAGEDFGRCLDEAQGRLNVLMARARLLSRQTARGSVSGVSEAAAGAHHQQEGDSSRRTTFRGFLKEDFNAHARVPSENTAAYDNADETNPSKAGMSVVHQRWLQLQQEGALTQALPYLQSVADLASNASGDQRDPLGKVPINQRAELVDKLVRSLVESTDRTANDWTRGKHLVAVYFGRGDDACRAFTARFVEAYHRIKYHGHDAGRPLKVVFVSRDKHEHSFQSCCKSMPKSWLGVPFRVSHHSGTGTFDLREKMGAQFSTQGAKLPVCTLVDPATGHVVCADVCSAVAEDPSGEGYPWGGSLAAVQALCGHGLFSAAVGITNNWASVVREQVGSIANFFSAGGGGIVSGGGGGATSLGRDAASRKWVRRQTAAVARYLTQLCLQLPKKQARVAPASSASFSSAQVLAKARSDAVERMLQERFLPLQLGAYAPDHGTCCTRARESMLWRSLRDLLLGCVDAPLLGGMGGDLGGGSHSLALDVADLIARARAKDVGSLAFAATTTADAVLPAPLEAVFLPPVAGEANDVLQRLLAPFSSSGSVAPTELLLVLLQAFKNAEREGDGGAASALANYAKDFAAAVFASAAAAGRIVVSQETQTHHRSETVEGLLDVLRRPFDTATVSAYENVLKRLRRRDSGLPAETRAKLQFRRGILPVPLLAAVSGL